MAIKNRDRFLLEEMLMKCWNITDDIDTIAEYVAEQPDIPAKRQDELMNMLFGMRALYNQRFSSTMVLFNELINNK